jgi:hypothetical protein
MMAIGKLAIAGERLTARTQLSQMTIWLGVAPIAKKMSHPCALGNMAPFGSRATRQIVCLKQLGPKLLRTLL